MSDTSIGSKRTFRKRLGSFFRRTDEGPLGQGFSGSRTEDETPSPSCVDVFDSFGAIRMVTEGRCDWTTLLRFGELES